MNWDQFWNFLLELGTSFGLKILEAIIILIVGLKLTKWLKKWLKNSPKLHKLDTSLRSFLSSFAGIVLYVLLIVTIAMILDIPATSFITVLASCGVAIGLALQGSLSNFAGGLMILLFKPFKVGDFINAAGESGTVTDISVVYTILLTPDNKHVTIPNGSLMNAVIENYSTENLRRVDMTFSTAYNCDIDKTKAVIESVIAAHELALKDPAPFVRLSEHGDSALTYVARVWCKNSDYWNVHFDIMEGVKKAFDENGIEIPFPQLDIHVDKN